MLGKVTIQQLTKIYCYIQAHTNQNNTINSVIKSLIAIKVRAILNNFLKRTSGKFPRSFFPIIVPKYTARTNGSIIYECCK